MRLISSMPCVSTVVSPSPFGAVAGASAGRRAGVIRHDGRDRLPRRALHLPAARVKDRRLVVARAGDDSVDDEPKIDLNTLGMPMTLHQSQSEHHNNIQVSAD